MKTLRSATSLRFPLALHIIIKVKGGAITCFARPSQIKKYHLIAFVSLSILVLHGIQEQTKKEKDRHNLRGTKQNYATIAPKQTIHPPSQWHQYRAFP